MIAGTADSWKVYDTYTSGDNYEVSLAPLIPQAYPIRRMVSMQDIRTHPAFTASMKDLQNMWLARFGSDWVRSDVAEQEEFFDFAARRLLSAGRLESHHLTDPSAVVYKLVDVE